jgi:hypothetical protein
MMMQTNRAHASRIRFVGLAAWVALCSCSSSDQPPAGGRVEHPEPSTPAPPTTASVAPTEPAPAASVPSEVEEQPSGDSSLDKAIAEDKPARPWSKNVPKRTCKDDGECGDGFCDRGQCAAIWTYFERYGQRCERDDQCAFRPCIDGRCRSCVSDTECGERVRSVLEGKCRPDIEISGARECRGVIPSVVPQGPPAPRL